MRGGDRWVFLFFLGVLVFNWPFLTIFENSHFTALLTLWVLFILLTAAFSAFSDKDKNR